MDNDLKDMENMLREFTPKAPSDGARWNLERRLNDLEQPDEVEAPRRSRPKPLILMGVAASILFGFIIWSVLTDTPPPQDDSPVVTTPEQPSEVVAEDINEGPEFIGDETDVPAVISMKKHITDMQDMGVVRSPDNPPLRRVRREFVNEVKVRDPDTGKIYNIHKPGSETIYINLEDY